MWSVVRNGMPSEDRLRQEETFYRSRSERDEISASKQRLEDHAKPWSCVQSAGVAIFASVALSTARGASLSFLAGGKDANASKRWHLFRSGWSISMKIYVPIFLICTQIDCMDKMISGVPRRVDEDLERWM